MKPVISVIMSVYNGQDYLEETVRSVMAQSFKDWELVVINDCSTDQTEEILARLSAEDERIKVYPNEVNLRLPKSLNRAVSLSQGKYIARMDADDICLPDRLEKQFAFLEENSDIDLCSCRFLTVKNGVYASGGAGGRCDHKALAAMLCVANPILHPGVMAKSEVFREFPYDPTHTCTEDLELWTRLVTAKKKLAILPECLMIYRLHDKQITQTTKDRQKGEVLRVQEAYTAAHFEKMTEQMASFYIRGVYFKDEPDTKAFLSYMKWLKKKAGKVFGKDEIRYALFEILAEYKRCGVKGTKILALMLTFPPLFLCREWKRRKQAAKRDIAKCCAVAKSLGLKKTGGTDAYPIFTK